MTESMNAVVLTGYGGPEALVYQQVPKPFPQSGEVLIRVGACSINNADINTRTGWYAADSGFQEILNDQEKNLGEKATWNQTDITFPRIQGADLVGMAVAVGEGVDSAILNQRVIVDPWIRADYRYAEYRYVGSEIDGGFAEYVVVPGSNVYVVKSTLSDVELATIPCAYSTAENLATKGRVSSADTVLIMGASGGVGSAAIQLCKLRGATVIAIVGKGKEPLAQQLGADYVYCRDERLALQLQHHSITVCLDVVGGDYFSMVFKALEIGGRYVTSGAIAGPLVELDLRDLIYKDIEMTGANRCAPEIFQNLLRYLEQGLLTPPVAKVFPLSEMQAAQTFFQGKTFFGKVVITP